MKNILRRISTNGVVVLLATGLLAAACDGADSTTVSSTGGVNAGGGGSGGEGGKGGAGGMAGGGGSGCSGTGDATCNGVCTNTQKDTANCGSCGFDCADLAGVDPDAISCVDGLCVIACAAGKADCDKNPKNGCETDTTTNTNCGACGAACAPPNPLCAPDPNGGQYGCVNACPSGTPTLCGMSCVDLQTNIPNCGMCGNACADVSNGQPTCAMGMCGFVCNNGYMSNGTGCVDIDECTLGTDNCDPNATCVNTPGSFGCLCNSGYSGDGRVCTDIDECATNTDDCDTHASCANTPGSFTCTCNAGYVGNGSFCIDINECADGTDNCDPNANCTNTPGSFTCACKPGFTGNGLMCTDIDECALNTDNCDANATCTNLPGSFICTCKPGYTGDGIMCTDIDECANGTNNCFTPTTCVNTPGSYNCACLPPAELCNGVCKDTTNDPANCGACGVACTANQACVNGTCVGTGNLQLTLVWDIAGDMDLHLVTPTGKHIYFSNKGPNSATDFGQLDVDDLTGTGPENIFWATNYTPPTGNYVVCAVPYSISPNTTYNLTIKRPGHPDIVLSGTRATSSAVSTCDTTSPNYVTSFAYP